MKNVIAGIVIGLAIGGAMAWLFLRQPEHEAEKKEEHKEASLVQRGTNGQVFLKLDKATQERVGLKVATLAAATIAPEAKGYGRVIDPAPLAALVIEIASAHVAVEASTREFTRLKILHEQDQNVSTRALETAEAAAKHDQVVVEGLQMKLVTTWGKALASQADLPSFVRALGSREAALVRIDLPFGEIVHDSPTGGRLSVASNEANPIAAQWFGPAPNTDPQAQGLGFHFLLKDHPPAPGTTMLGWLRLPGEAEPGVVVPREALLRHEGEVFVYVQTADETFQREEIELDRPTEAGWFVSKDLKPGDKLVTVGAQQLFSEELKGKGGEE